MSENPYEAPGADIEQVSPEQEYNLRAPKTVSVDRGIGWIGDGFSMFKKSPGQWIATVIVWFVIMIGVSLIPILGQIALMLTTYVWIAGIMAGCRAQDQGQDFSLNHLFAGFSQKTGQLILLSVIAAIGSMLIMIVVVGPSIVSLMFVDPTTNPEAFGDPMTFLLSILFAMLIMIPFIMAVWFAPTLIMLHDVGIFEAMKMSFMGCLKNVIPFLIYGIVALVLYIVALIPLLLGLLVLGPVLFASMYVAYKDIFIEQS